MKKLYISILALFVGMCSLTAQVGFGTDNPSADAVLEVSSTTQGMAFPRMGVMSEIVSPATGLVVFDVANNCLAVNVGTPAAPEWECMGASTLDRIGADADDETTTTTVTAAEIAAIDGVTGVDPDNEAAYQDYIDNNPDLFSAPATVAEVQAMIDAVNANEETGGEAGILAQIGTEADAGTVSTVTAEQLAALTGITGVDPTKEADYQQYIADNPDAFSSPATLAEVQAMIDALAYPEGDATFTLPQTATVLSVYDAGPPIVDIQGVIDNATNQLIINVPYTSGAGSYGAYTSAAVAVTGEGGDTNTITISYPAGDFNATGTISVTVTVD